MEPAPPEDWEEVPTQVQLGWLPGGVPEPPPPSDSGPRLRRAPGEGAEQLENPRPNPGDLGLPGDVDRRVAPLPAQTTRNAGLRRRVGYGSGRTTEVRTAPTAVWSSSLEPRSQAELEPPRAPTPAKPPDSMAGRRALPYRRPVPAPTPLRHQRRSFSGVRTPPDPMLMDVDERLRQTARREKRSWFSRPEWLQDGQDVAAFAMVFLSTLVLGLVAIWLLTT